MAEHDHGAHDLTDAQRQYLKKVAVSALNGDESAEAAYTPGSPAGESALKDAERVINNPLRRAATIAGVTVGECTSRVPASVRRAAEITGAAVAGGAASAALITAATIVSQNVTTGDAWPIIATAGVIGGIGGVGLALGVKKPEAKP